MAKIKTVEPSLAKSTLKAPPALVLKTPAGSSMKVGSNTQPWENTGSYIADQTAAGYGDVPAMTMNAPAPVSPTPLQVLTGVDGLANPYTSLALNPNYSKFTSGIKDQWGSFGSPDGGLGSYGTYEYGPSTNSQTGQVIPGGSVGVNADAYGAINNPDVTPSAGGAGMTMSDVGGYAGLAQAGISLFNGINSYNLGKKNLSLAKDMFGFEKAATNRNMTNQATEYNTGVQNRGEVGMSLAGNTMDQGARDARQAQLNSYKISTAPIG